MLFDPFEEQFDLPTTAIKIGDALRRHVEIVGQKDQLLALCIFDSDASDCSWKVLLRIEHVQRTQLVADDARRTIHWPGVLPRKAQIRLGSRYKETASLVQPMQSGEVEITPVHDVERARLGNDLVENIHIVHLPIADMNKTWNVAAQVEQRMQLYRCFGRTKRRPRKDRQTQIDSSRIQRVDCLGEIDAKRFVQVKWSSYSDQALRKVGVDSPISNRIRIGQRISRHLAAKAHVVELGGLTAQTSFDVAQTLAIGQLRERHAQKLIETCEVFDLVLSIVSSDTSAESGQRQVRHHLRKNKFARIHWQSSQSGWKYPECYLTSSNRDQT